MTTNPPINPSTSYEQFESNFLDSNMTIQDLHKKFFLMAQENVSLDRMITELNRQIEDYLQQHKKRDAEDKKDAENFNLMLTSLREERDRLQKEVGHAERLANSLKNSLDNILYQSVDVLNDLDEEGLQNLQQMLVNAIRVLTKRNQSEF